MEAVATSGGREYREGYQLIRHRDLPIRYLYRDAVTTVRGVDVQVRRGLKVGYVMGIGDEVPSGLAQLGAEVNLLDAADLATGNLSRYDSIITGTRAYAVREDLKTYNGRLLEYVQNGGNLIVLYNTQELAPNTFAPYAGELLRTAEEVSEEDSPVTILAPQDAKFIQETVTFQLKPKEGIEYKYRLEKGEALLYSWSSSAPMNTEFHAEPDGGPRGYAQTYEKKDGMNGASGTLNAPFSGIHGWYWENTSNREVTVTLHTAGFYDEAMMFLPKEPPQPIEIAERPGGLK